jgi:hypothetical protein
MNKFLSFLEENPTLSIGGAIVAVLLLGSTLLRKQSSVPNSVNGLGDTSGLATDQYGNKLVYIPTSTDFTTYNSDSGNITGSNNPVTINNPVGIPTGIFPHRPPGPKPPPPHIPPPGHKPPPPGPKPAGHLQWGARYTVKRGDSLSSIANGSTSYMRRFQHAPSSVRVTANDLYAHNKSVIDSTAKSHKYNGNPMNFVVQGEVILLPSWIA